MVSNKVAIWPIFVLDCCLRPAMVFNLLMLICICAVFSLWNCSSSNFISSSSAVEFVGGVFITAKGLLGLVCNLQRQLCRQMLWKGVTGNALQAKCFFLTCLALKTGSFKKGIGENLKLKKLLIDITLNTSRSGIIENMYRISMDLANLK